MINIFNNIKLARENKELKAKVRKLTKQLQESVKLIQSQQEDINKLHADFMRFMKDDTISVSVDETGKITEYVKYTPDYFLVDKTGNTSIEWGER